MNRYSVHDLVWFFDDNSILFFRNMGFQKRAHTDMEINLFPHQEAYEGQ